MNPLLLFYFFPPLAPVPVVPAAQPGFLTGRQLDSLRVTVKQSLPWFGTVQENTPARDAAGDLADDWQDVVVYNCDVELMTDAEEVPVAGQMQAVGSYLVTLPWDAVIEAKNRIVINRTTYEIRNRLTNWTDQCAVYVSAEEVT